MKIVAISDTHTLHNKVNMPEGDMLICAGDFTDQGSITDVAKFASWLAWLPYKYKIVIAGNHDFIFEREGYSYRHTSSSADMTDIAINLLTEKGVIYLQDQACVIEDIKIYGSPWQPRFFDWAFNADRGEELQRIWANIPEKTDILITHGPPAGILDVNVYGKGGGCQDLMNRIKVVKPKIHIFGHFHLKNGIVEQDGTKFVNATICNEKYKPVHKPVVIDYES